MPRKFNPARHDKFRMICSKLLYVASHCHGRCNSAQKKLLPWEEHGHTQTVPYMMQQLFCCFVALVDDFELFFIPKNLLRVLVRVDLSGTSAANVDAAFNGFFCCSTAVSSLAFLGAALLLTGCPARGFAVSCSTGDRMAATASRSCFLRMTPASSAATCRNDTATPSPVFADTEKLHTQHSEVNITTPTARRPGRVLHTKPTCASCVPEQSHRVFLC